MSTIHQIEYCQDLANATTAAIYQQRCIIDPSGLIWRYRTDSMEKNEWQHLVDGKWVKAATPTNDPYFFQQTGWTILPYFNLRP